MFFTRSDLKEALQEETRCLREEISQIKEGIYSLENIIHTSITEFTESLNHLLNKELIDDIQGIDFEKGSKEDDCDTILVEIPRHIANKMRSVIPSSTRNNVVVRLIEEEIKGRQLRLERNKIPMSSKKNKGT